MARTTQYVGLTQDALNYVQKHSLGEEDVVITAGITLEPVYGKIYHLPPHKGPNKGLYLREVVQASPWSSGPMIFTCLHAVLVKERDDQEVVLGDWFQWVLNPDCSGIEYDRERGHYYV